MSISIKTENGIIKVANVGGSGGNADAVILTKEEYDALPDTKLTDNKQYFVKDWTQGGGSGSGITYSTSEVDTGKIWIDGKHIYTKVFVFDTIAKNDTLIDLGFTLDTLLNVTGEMDNGDYKFPVNTVWVSTTNIYCLIISNNKTQFIARTPLACSCKIIIEYTKVDE